MPKLSPPVQIFMGSIDTLHVLSWCPTPEPTVPPTQVHLVIPIEPADGVPRLPTAPTPLVVLRFKGTDGIDRLIAALQDHRQDVWGPPPVEYDES